MNHKENKFILVFGTYISLLLTFNEFLGIYLPTLILRGIYIAMLFGIILYCLLNNRFKISISFDRGFIILYLIYMAIRYITQVLTGTVSELSGTTFLQAFIPVFFYFVAQIIRDNEAKKIETILVILSTVSALIGIIDRYIKILPNLGSFAGGLYAGIGNGVYTTRGYSLAGNALSTGFMCGLSICLLVFSNKNLVEKKLVYYSCLIILFAGLLLSLSRGAIMMVVLGGVAYVIQKKHVTGSRISSKKAALVILLFFVGVLGLALFSDRLFSSNIFGRLFIAGFNTTEHSNAKRIYFIQNTMKQIGDSLIFGKGFGFVGSRANNLGIANSINTESYLLSLIVDGGVILLTLFLLSCQTAFKEILNCKSLNDALYTSIVFGILSWSVLYIVLDSDLNGLFFWYALGRINKRNNESIVSITSSDEFRPRDLI